MQQPTVKVYLESEDVRITNQQAKFKGKVIPLSAIVKAEVREWDVDERSRRRLELVRRRCQVG
jgi:hypothetical protein